MLSQEKVVYTATNIPIYEQGDVAGAFPHAYELVLNVAARWACVSINEVVIAVRHIEMKLLQRIAFAKRRKARALRKARMGATGGEGEDIDIDISEGSDMDE